MARMRPPVATTKKGRAKRKSPSSTILPDVDLTAADIEVWRDPEWEPALHALEGWQRDGKFNGNSDPKPLAKLLRSGKPVPEAVAVALGVLLDPPWGKKGPNLTASIPRRYSPFANLQTVKKMIDARREIEEALQRSGGKLDAAIAEVQEKSGRSRSYLMKAWKFDMPKAIVMTSKFNPQPFLSPRDSKES
jgi:hypothetical protein